MIQGLTFWNLYLAVSSKANPLTPALPHHVAFCKLHLIGPRWKGFKGPQFSWDKVALKHHCFRREGMGQWVVINMFPKMESMWPLWGAAYSELELGPFLRPPKVSTTFTNLAIKLVKNGVV